MKNTDLTKNFKIPKMIRDQGAQEVAIFCMGATSMLYSMGLRLKELGDLGITSEGADNDIRNHFHELLDQAKAERRK